MEQYKFQSRLSCKEDGIPREFLSNIVTITVYPKPKMTVIQRQKNHDMCFARYNSNCSCLALLLLKLIF